MTKGTKTGNGKPTAKAPAPPQHTLELGKGEDREPEDYRSLQPIGGSKHRPFNTVVLNQVLHCLWTPDGLAENERHNRWAAAMAAMRGFHPRDEVEGLMAAQAVALHNGAMECLRRAMIPEQPGEAATQLCRQGANLSRSFVEMVAALGKRRGKGTPQVFRVERVQVAPGGQAIVGNVAPGAGHVTQPAPPVPDAASGSATLAAPQPDLGSSLNRACPEPVPAHARG